MRRAVFVGAALLLAACQTRPQIVAAPTPQPMVMTPPPVIARAPAAPRPCVPRSLGPAPRYPDTDAALRDAAGAADRYQLMAAGRLQRLRRLAELERAVAACR